MESNTKSRTVRCRFYGNNKGCRAGEACPFLHEQSMSNTLQQSSLSFEGRDSPLDGSPQASEQRRFLPHSVDRTMIVQRPISQTQQDDPREFEMAQVRRRFSPKESSDQFETTLTFRMAPSDPDFPFDMVGLDCVLHVPLRYPFVAVSLEVQNKQMGRGYQINVERGFELLATGKPRMTLLALMNTLDKQLELLLIEQKAPTIKFVANASAVPNPSSRSSGAIFTGKPSLSPPTRPAQEYSHAAIMQANARRASETRQLEARLGRLPFYARSSDGLAYTLPLEPRRRGELPMALQNIKMVKLFVPMLYPLKHPRIELLAVSKEAAATVESAFEKRAEEVDMTLMALMNHLAQNMHLLATEPIDDQREAEDMDMMVQNLELLEAKADDAKSKPHSGSIAFSNDRSEKSHVVVIPRPPEWVMVDDGGVDDLSDDSWDELNSSGTDEDPALNLTEGAHLLPSTPLESGPEHGVLLSFPSLELHGIELLDLMLLAVTVKCDRCKDQMDIKGLWSRHERIIPAKRESCKKCANAFEIGYRRELMHAHSIRAGYLDLDGCTAVDLLPSTFVPTCSECSTLQPGIVAVRGDSTTVACRECHQKMRLKIPEMRFLLMSSMPGKLNIVPRRKKARENLGITAGQQLDRRGRCAHYSKSYRWFRFSCCDKVFPCDRCHDEASDHLNEHANRMICGFCSREQNYAPESCRFCHSTLIGTKGSGFWEGGKGTRDPVKMNRNDPRKYKRRAKAKD